MKTPDLDFILIEKKNTKPERWLKKFKYKIKLKGILHAANGRILAT